MPAKKKKGAKKKEKEKKPAADGDAPEEIPEWKIPLPKHGWMMLKVSRFSLNSFSLNYVIQSRIRP